MNKPKSEESIIWLKNQPDFRLIKKDGKIMIFLEIKGEKFGLSLHENYLKAVLKDKASE